MNISRRQFFIGLGASSIGLIGANLSQLTGEQIKAQTPSSDLLLRFAAIADTGTGNDGQYAIANAMNNYYQQKPYPMVVLAGDNIYNQGEIEKINDVFEKPYAPLLEKGVKFRAALGNHDVLSNDGEDEVKYAAFNMSSRYYTFNQGKVQFFALDTNVNARWSQQLAWLDKSLAESKAPWKIVFGHHPVYSSGLHGSTQALVESLPPLFAKYGVHLYLCGHDHNYERSLSLNGTTYIVHGGGANTRPMGKSDFTAYAESKLSFLIVEVTNKEIRTEAIGTDGQIFDRGAIAI